jgi:hypothetical protein
MGEIIMLAVVAVAAFVFFYQPHFGRTTPQPPAAVDPERATSGTSGAATPESQPKAVDDSLARESVRRQASIRPSGPDATPQLDAAERDAASKLSIAGPVLSPAIATADTFALDSSYRARQQWLCVERAAGVVSSGGQGTGAAIVDHIGTTGDSLAFDGIARSTTGRAMVWRCTIAATGRNVGRMSFTSADSVPGLVLLWDPVATLDDYVLRRCIVRAQSLFPAMSVLPRASGRRRDDQVRLLGVAEGGGLSTNWSCGVTVHGDRIVSLEARVGG